MNRKKDLNRSTTKDSDNKLNSHISERISVFVKNKKYSKAMRIFATVLAGFVVFTTTYSLILPAISMELETTDEVGVILHGKDLLDETDDKENDTDPEDSSLEVDEEETRLIEKPSSYHESTVENSGYVGLIDDETSTDNADDNTGQITGYNEEVHADLSVGDLDSEWTLTASADNVNIKLSYPQEIPAGSSIAFHPTNSAYYYKYYSGAKVVLEENYEGWEVLDGQFWNVIAAPGRDVKVELEYCELLGASEDNAKIRYALIDCSDGEWHLYNNRTAAIEFNEEGTLNRIIFRTDALKNSAAVFGVFSLVERQETKIENTEGEIIVDENTEDETAEAGNTEGEIVVDENTEDGTTEAGNTEGEIVADETAEDEDTAADDATGGNIDDGNTEDEYSEDAQPGDTGAPEETSGTDTELVDEADDADVAEDAEPVQTEEHAVSGDAQSGELTGSEDAADEEAQAEEATEGEESQDEETAAGEESQNGEIAADEETQAEEATEGEESQDEEAQDEETAAGEESQDGEAAADEEKQSEESAEDDAKPAEGASVSGQNETEDQPQTVGEAETADAENTDKEAGTESPEGAEDAESPEGAEDTENPEEAADADGTKNEESPDGTEEQGKQEEASVEPSEDDQKTEGEGAADTAEAESEEEESTDEKEVDESSEDLLKEYPAQLFSSKGEVSVYVTAPEGAFPVDTTMIVTPVEEEADIENITDTITDSSVSRIQAVDIAFFDKKGNEIEPKVPIRVRLVADRMKSDEEAVIVHVDDNGTVEEVKDASITVAGSQAYITMKAGEETAVSEEENPEETENETADYEASAYEADNEAAADEADNEAAADEADNETVAGEADNEAAIGETDADKEADLIEGPQEDIPTDSTGSENSDASVTEGAGTQEDILIEGTVTEDVVREDNTREDDAQEADAQGSDADEDNGHSGLEEENHPDSLTAEFEADEFSIYAVVYTVDFHYEVNGKTYEFSIPGGGYVTLQQLVELLGIPGDTDSSKNAADDTAENIAEADETNLEASSLTLEDVAVSEETRKFVAEVESVEFSDPGLVWVGKVENDSTVGGLKETKSLACENSAELTEEQIAEINKSTVEAGDWALISMHPFDTEENLTVTMKGGDQFVVRVTDAQISTNILTADGLSFCITVTYDESAEIPKGTVLQAEEIEPDTDEYLQYLGRTWSEINRTYSESKNQNESDNDAPEERNINVNMARFFDIKLIYQDEEIEPKTPVQVEITYTKGLLSLDQTQPGVVHFTKEGNIEILEEVETEVEGDAVVSFHYEQDSFSVIGTYIQQETHDAETPPHVSKFTPTSTFLTKGGISPIDAGTGEGNVIIPPIALRGTEEPESSYENDSSKLQKPTGNKTLVPNEDGTYTLTLSVKGHSQSEIKQRQKKANVLFVMDRSSSMITNTVSDEEQFWYYGTWNTNNTTFRADIRPDTGYQFYGLINGQYVELNVSSTWSSWYDYNLTYWNGFSIVNYPTDYPIYVKSKTTRLYAEQEALNEVIDNLLSYNSAETPDSVELALISFAYRRGNLSAWASETEHPGWVTGIGENDDLSGLLNAIDSTRYASGTNWEEALQYAYEVISAKERAEAGKPEEDYYVIFLTDGEPTNTANAVNESAGNTDNMVSYNAARDEARNLAKYHFYNIFTYRNPNKEDDIYSVYLTNYAYNQGTDPNGDRENDYVKEYYSDAKTIDSLKDKLSNIIQVIADVIGHANVSITDTLTTDAMTTTIEQGKTNGYVYTVKDPSGTVLYTVTATGDIDNPTVTFNVPASATKTYTASPTDVGGRTLYSVTTAEGDEYRIALADVDGTTGKLTWDLSPVGILMDDCTYSISFVVWPDQEAYDYVAGLNNGLPGYTWDTSPENDAYQDLTDTKGFEIGGVSRFPSIVKYPDGTFAVLTNMDQKVHYSVVEMQTINGEPNGDPTTHGPYYQDLETPDPMELTATETKLQKVWGIERNPSTLAQLLYDDEGNPTQFQINYGIKILDQGETGTGSEGPGAGQEDPDEGQDEPSYYTTLTLGWDGTKYDWDPNSVRYVSLNWNSGPSVPVGTSWSKDFAIATGLMLSEARMDALGLDKDAYGPPYSYGSTNYYILETGHDYTIEEIIPEDAPRDAYQFDFEAPVYHPMLVDGKLKSVVFNRDEENNAIINIKEISKEDWLLSLKIENTLRGYIKLEKDIVDKDGHTPLPEDDTEFEYEIDIEDPASIGRFTGTHIPWYGVDRLFYHSIDEEGNYHYFQAETNTTDKKAHEFTLTTESGEECPAVCIDEAADGIFDEDTAGPTLIQYVENGVTKQISLFGNQMEHLDDNHVHAVMKINQYQVLDISNVPAKSTYTIKEVNQEGYNLVNIRREIRNNNTVESGNTYTGSMIVSGVIVPDRDNCIIYTNKIYSVDLTVKKTDENDMPLTGAVFSLYKKDGASWMDAPVATAPGEDEEDTAVYEFINLEDGSYKLVETPPEGYAAVDDVFFTVTNGVLSIDGTLPAGVTKDEEQLLLTVKNSPRTDSLTVRKQWLDYNGNPRDYDGTLDLKLLQYVQNTANNYDVTVNFRYTGDNGSPFVTKTGHGSGPATIKWQWNQYTTYPGVSQITITGLNTGEYTVTKGSNYWFTLSINNVNRNMNVTVTVSNSNYNPYHYDGTAITDIDITEETITEEYSATGGTKTITLGENSIWANTLTVSGNGLLSDDSTTLPATYNGKNCYYSIAEESVPEGYELTQISTDKIKSGVLTAYNKRTSEDVDVTVRKEWEDGLNENGTTTSHQENLVVTLSNGQSVTLNDGNHWEATITDLPKYDEEGNEIAYSWTEDELANGYYMSDSNTVIYDNTVTTTLTNSYSEHYMPEMEIDGVKIWDDDGTENRPSSITVKLYKDNVLYKTTAVTPPTGENADPNSWTFKFTNLPIFNTDADGNATGTLAVYTIEEVLPAGYTSDYEITIQQVQATYEAGTAEAHIINSYSSENQLISAGADLGFVVVRHGQGYVVWTPRPLRDGELDKIKAAADDASHQFKGILTASGDNLTIISGVPRTVKVGNKEAATVYMKDGDVWVRFENPSAESDIVYGSIPYTYTQIGGEGGVAITNVRKTTSISGTKTWIDGGRQHNNAEEITLKLYRTNKPVTDDSQWEEVQLTATGTINLSWDGNTYTYSNLPRYSDYTSNPPVEYEYRVEETAVNVTEGMGAGQHTVSYKMENDGNNFINTELINIEATKTWKDAGVSVNAALTNASVTFELQKKDGDNWIKIEQDGITNPQTLSVTETADANAWKAVWNSLPKYEKSGEDIVSIEYRVVETAASLEGQDVKPDTDPSASVSAGGKANIDNILQITISILKVDANDNSIKLGNAEFKLTKVQSLETTNQVTEHPYCELGTTSDADDDTKGTLQFTGITPGYYYLHETKAPDGYILTTANGWHFQVGESGIIQGVGDFTDDGTFEYVDAKKVTVSNTPGASLPYTGGPGTRLFTILGSILILGAGVLLRRRRRLI